MLDQLIEVLIQGKDYEILCFEIIIVKRMIHNYESFSRRNNFGDIETINSIPEFALKFLFGEKLDIGKLLLVREALLELAPDSEMYPGVDSTYALDTCAACDSLLSYLIDNDKESISRCSKLAMETVYISIADTYNIEEDDIIGEHTLMINEINFQIALIRKIISVKDMDDIITIANGIYNDIP